MGADGNGGASERKLSPTAVYMLSRAIAGYETLFATTFFADEIAASDETDYPEVLRNLITRRRYSDGQVQGRFSIAKFFTLNATDHRELCNTVITLNEHDIPLKLALRECGFPDEEELADCIQQEMNELTGCCV